MIIKEQLHNYEPTSRRSRKDEQGRDYMCGCGKRYLSYPALYTHIKTKHNGNSPEGTLKTGTTVTQRRSSKNKIEQQTIRHIYAYFEKQDLRLLSQLDQNYQGTVPLNSRIRRESLPKQFYECYNQLIKLQQCNLTKESSLDLVLTVYLLNIGEYVNSGLYEYYLIFARLLKSCYLQYGQQVHKACFNNKENGQSYLQNFTAVQVQYIPIICDCLTRYYIPFGQNAKQNRSVNLSLIELILYDFCKWLQKKKLTCVKVELKKQYRLESKPVILKKQQSNSGKTQNNITREKKYSQNAQEQDQKKMIAEESEHLSHISHQQIQNQKHQDAIFNQINQQIKMSQYKKDRQAQQSLAVVQKQIEIPVILQNQINNETSKQKNLDPEVNQQKNQEEKLKLQAKIEQKDI